MKNTHEQVAPEKKPYRKPQVIVYGEITDLTHGQSGPLTDGKSANPMT